MGDPKINNSLSNIIQEDLNSQNNILEDIAQQYPPSLVYLPYGNKIYDINLNTRTIDSPEVLSLRSDHKSEVIYFRVKRYQDFMDLANTNCIIQYMIPGEELPYVYVVPFLDILTERNEGNIIFPWQISQWVAKRAGIIKYSIRFFKVETKNGETFLTYNLNTLPAQSEIKETIVNEDIQSEMENIEANQFQILIDQINSSKICWTILEEE